jgi:hypothetical protein
MDPSRAAGRRPRGVQIQSPRLIHNANFRRWLRERLATGFELSLRFSRMTLLERCCWITKRPGPGNPHFEGLMDELVIYNRDLTEEELQELIKK